MKWGIIGAMPSEVALIRDRMEDICEAVVGRFTFYDGLLCGKEATLVQCGIGKVNAAITAQILIDRFGVEAVINTGIAGAIHHDLKVLDVVISRELCYHDYNARHLRAYVPFLEKIEASELLVEAALEAFEEIDHGSACCFVGRIATGDQFIESREVKQKIIDNFHPMCVEMEGAAIGHACTANDIPFLVVRTMSDNADEQASDTAEDFELHAASHSANLVIRLIEKYS